MEIAKTIAEQKRMRANTYSDPSPLSCLVKSSLGAVELTAINFVR